MPPIQELAENIRRQITPTYPSLRVDVRGGFVLASGILPIMDQGSVIDRFEIEVQLAPTYPAVAPKVREIGGRIPRLDDRHCNKDGTLCLMVEEEYWLDAWASKTFLEFLDGPVRSYFLYQLAVEAGVPWPHGDRPHGGAGVADFYRERFGMQGVGAAIRCLELVLVREVRGHQVCMCGNGLKIRKCTSRCRRLIEDVGAGVPREVVLRSLDHLRKEAAKTINSASRA